MNQLTIRGVDKQLHQRLRQEAQKRGVSMNRYVLMVLQKTTGLSDVELFDVQKYDDLDHLAGRWSEEEGALFDEQLAAQREIDAELWS